MKAFIVVLVVLMHTCAGVNAQQVNLVNQYIVNPYLINPADAGQQKFTQAFFLYRHQWTGIPGSPTTQAVTLDGPMSPIPVGLGMAFMNEESGIVSRLSGLVTASYKTKLSDRDHLTFGLSPGFVRNRINFDRIKGDAADPALSQQARNASTFDIHAGLTYQRDRFKLGISGMQMLNRSLVYDEAADFTQARFRLVRHYLVSFEYALPLSNEWTLTPLILFRSVQGLSSQIDINTKLIFKKLLWTNFVYRRKNSIGLAFGAVISERITAGYSFDYPITGFQTIGGGSHEVLIGYRFSGGSRNVGSSKSPRLKDYDTFVRNTNAQFEKLDEIQQQNEKLNEQLLIYKRTIENQNNEIEKLRAQINAFDNEIRTLIEKLKVDLDRDEPFDNSYDYFLVVGAFKSLEEAKSFQKIIKREASYDSKVIQSTSATWFFVFTERVKSRNEARKKIRAITNSRLQEFVIGDPWIYKARATAEQ